MPELRCKPSLPAWQTLQRLKELWGYRYPVQVVEHLANEAAARYLAPTSFQQDQAKAVKVLARVKPNWIIYESEIVKVAKTSSKVEIFHRLETAPIVVNRELWEQS
jgi:hypothetical protein